MPDFTIGAFLLPDGWRFADLSNAILAWVAGMAHIYAAVHTSRWLRGLFISVAALALFYSFGYWWLVFNPERVSDWSNFYRPYGQVTWIIAWSLEPFIIVYYLRRLAYGLIGNAQKAVGEAREEASRITGVPVDDLSVPIARRNRGGESG